MRVVRQCGERGDAWQVVIRTAAGSDLFEASFTLPMWLA
jgi:hypothetical protein